MATIEPKKCEHPVCTCTVPADQDYCSPYCEAAGSEEVEIACDCHHPGCSLADQSLAGPGARPHL
jgi:hypothetical protein